MNATRDPYGFFCLAAQRGETPLDMPMPYNIFTAPLSPQRYHYVTPVLLRRQLHPSSPRGYTRGSVTPSVSDASYTTVGCVETQPWSHDDFLVLEAAAPATAAAAAADPFCVTALVTPLTSASYLYVVTVRRESRLGAAGLRERVGIAFNVVDLQNYEFLVFR